VPEASHGETRVADVLIRYIETEREGLSHFYAAGAPLTGEWCYLADAEFLPELEVAVAALLDNSETRGIFERTAALLGVPWNEGGMVTLLDAQLENGKMLLERAPDVATADPGLLRKLRNATDAEHSGSD
jgi:hypothetical protein